MPHEEQLVQLIREWMRLEPERFQQVPATEQHRSRVVFIKTLSGSCPLLKLQGNAAKLCVASEQSLRQAFEESIEEWDGWMELGSKPQSPQRLRYARAAIGNDVVYQESSNLTHALGTCYLQLLNNLCQQMTVSAALVS